MKSLQKRFGGMRTLLALGVFVPVLLCGLLAGCQPSATESGVDAPAAEESALASTEGAGLPGDFENNDAGFLPDSFYATECINAGNRGCNSCHPDLHETIKDLSILEHGLGEPRYGKSYTYMDCITCHSMKRSFGAMGFADAIHTLHLSNETFNDDYSGNCWNCHALNSDGDIVMWDEYKYSSDFGGYINSGDPTTQYWNARRGYTSGNMSGLSYANNLALDVEVSQPTIENEDDLYVLQNYEVPDTATIAAEDYRFVVTGTNNDREFTLEELKALPATEQQITQCCLTNPINGGFVASWPAKGVLIEDIVEACGGVPEGNGTVSVVTGDGWDLCRNLNLAELIKGKAMVAYEFFGHELTPGWGYPAVTVMPGQGAPRWGKWATGLEFSSEPDSGGNWVSVAKMPRAMQGAICSGWFDPVADGNEYKLGEAIPLRGYAYVLNQLDDQGGDHHLAQIAISADRGATWQTIDVPADYDPMQWTCFETSWTPEKPGVYTLQVKSIDAGGYEQIYPASVILTVTE